MVSNKSLLDWFKNCENFQSNWLYICINLGYKLAIMVIFSPWPARTFLQDKARNASQSHIFPDLNLTEHMWDL